MGWLWKRAPVEDPGDEYKYAITIDSGSSGSRLEIYSWLDNSIAEQRANATERGSLPVINIGRQKKYPSPMMNMLIYLESIQVCEMIRFS